LPLAHLSSLYSPVAKKLLELARNKNTACTRNANQRLLKTNSTGVCIPIWSTSERERSQNEMFFTWRRTNPPFLETRPGTGTQFVARGCW